MPRPYPVSPSGCERHAVSRTLRVTRMDLSVCLLWHMHQPVYLDTEAGEYILPWVFLHGVKDYYEMARHLEAVPEMH